MTPEKEKSLVEILDNSELNPLTLLELHRMQVRYGVDLDFYKDKQEAVITLENSKEYWFYLNQGMYYLRGDE